MVLGSSSSEAQRDTEALEGSTSTATGWGHVLLDDLVHTV